MKLYYNNATTSTTTTTTTTTTIIIITETNNHINTINNKYHLMVFTLQILIYYNLRVIISRAQRRTAGRNKSFKLL